MQAINLWVSMLEIRSCVPVCFLLRAGILRILRLEPFCEMCGAEVFPAEPGAVPLCCSAPAAGRRQSLADNLRFQFVREN